MNILQKLNSWLFGVEYVDAYELMMRSEKEFGKEIQLMYDKMYVESCNAQAIEWLNEYKQYGRDNIRLRNPAYGTLNCNAFACEESPYYNNPIDMHALANKMIEEYIAEHGEVLSQTQIFLKSMNKLN